MRLARLLVVLAAALMAGCSTGPPGPPALGPRGHTLEVAAVWSGVEQQHFELVLRAFTRQTGVSVTYTSAGYSVPAFLADRQASGHLPEVAFLPQPGLLRRYAAEHVLIPLDGVVGSVVAGNYSPAWRRLGSAGGTLYGIWFKAANKSLVWYNEGVFEREGVAPPASVNGLVSLAHRLARSGIPAFSVGGQDGWTLSDWFSNLYLRLAGPARYDLLAAHEIPWTDPSVKQALQAMAQVFKDSSNIVGGTNGALQTDFPTSAANVFTDPPKGAQIMEGDFVPGSVKTDLKPVEGYNVFPFPQVGDNQNVVVGGGDIAIAFEDNPAVQAFMKYLTTTKAAQIWAEQGGFASLNTGLDPSVYPSQIEQTTAGVLSSASAFRFDMSDLQPASFGATVGQGEWKIFTDFVKNPNNIDGTAQALEAAAKKAYGS
jgi:hypothetical protein